MNHACLKTSAVFEDELFAPAARQDDLTIQLTLALQHKDHCRFSNELSQARSTPFCYEIAFHTSDRDECRMRSSDFDHLDA